jgi:hypothetical protein
MAPLSVREWNCTTSSFSEPTVHVSGQYTPQYTSDGGAWDAGDQHEGGMDEPAPFQLHLEAVNITASAEDVVAEVLRNSTRLLEVTPDGQVLILMPAYSLSHDGTECFQGLDAISHVPDAAQQHSQQCPFVLLRLRVMVFRGGDKVLCCECSNPGCTRLPESRELYRHEFQYPEQPVSWREDVLGGWEPLCECGVSIVKQLWVDEPLEGDVENRPDELLAIEGAPEAFVQWFLDQDSVRTHLISVWRCIDSCTLCMLGTSIVNSIPNGRNNHNVMQELQTLTSTIRGNCTVCAMLVTLKPLISGLAGVF